MKATAFAGVALCALAISGCAAVTERTGLTAEQQVCIATSAARIVQQPSTRDLPMLDKIGFVSAECGVDLTKLVTDTIQTAILAADKAE